jgi:hypothetical protein
MFPDDYNYIPIEKVQTGDIGLFSCSDGEFTAVIVEITNYDRNFYNFIIRDVNGELVRLKNIDISFVFILKESADASEGPILE